jgi:hypothetical protein
MCKHNEFAKLEVIFSNFMSDPILIVVMCRSKSQNSVTCVTLIGVVATGWTTDDTFYSRRRHETLFLRSVHIGLESHFAFRLMSTRSCFPGVKVKNSWTCPSFPPTIMACCVIKHRGSFTFFGSPCGMNHMKKNGHHNFSESFFLYVDGVSAHRRVFIHSCLEWD